MLLSSLGALLGVNSDDFFKNPIILLTDVKELINFFCPKDKDVRYLILLLHRVMMLAWADKTVRKDQMPYLDSCNTWKRKIRYW